MQERTMQERTRIKICGLKEEGDVAAAVEAGADTVGFVMYAKSARHVTPQRAGQLARALPPFVMPVLLFVNASYEAIDEALAEVPQALLQFHGDEPPAFCDAVRRPYLRAVAMKAGVDLLDWSQRFKNAAALLLDAPVDGYGGGGKVFNWSLAHTANVRTPVVLSGGLSAANVIDGIARVRPYAVDVSSGVERSKGVKDAALIREFCEAVREADARRADTEV